MTNWTIRVDWLDYGGGPNDAELDNLVDALAEHHAAISTEHDKPNYPVRMSATITLEAGSLRQAVAAALQTVEAAAGHKACGLEVLATHEYDHRAAEPSIPELVGYAEIAELAGVSRQRAAQLADIEGFPPAVVQVKAGPLRVRRQVEAWLANWQRKSGRPKKAAAGTG